MCQETWNTDIPILRAEGRIELGIRIGSWLDKTNKTKIKINKTPPKRRNQESWARQKHGRGSLQICLEASVMGLCPLDQLFPGARPSHVIPGQAQASISGNQSCSACSSESCPHLPPHRPFSHCGYSILQQACLLSRKSTFSCKIPIKHGQ